MKLPIETERQNIIRIINENPVTIISGNTGCGKSTKIPEYLADEGYRVIITQPRRLAAISLARRVAKNCKHSVGFHTGLEKSITEDSIILFKTEEIVLLELLSNTEKLENTVLVIDEIHEQNTCTDFMLAWIKQYLYKSDVNFKLVLMSATLETPKLAEFFNNAPVINISAAPYTIGTVNFSANKIEETILTQVKHRQNVLVFLPGKAEILKMAKSLRKKFKAYMIQADIFPLYAEQPYEEQRKVFTRTFYSKVILATNIAQTSITIPDIDTVIDTALEKTMTYQGNVPTLSLKNISKSDCIQRKGRVGRCSPGNYILCSDTKWKYREDYNLPKIQYEDLSKFLLLFIKYHIDISELEFLNTPASCNIENGMEVLKLLGALDEDGTITDIGLKMCEISLSPRFARILVAVKSTSDNQLMLDTAICCLLLEFGSITSDYKVSSLCALKSDLFYQLEIFKHIDKYSIDAQSIDYSSLKKIRYYLPKILNQIGCEDVDMNNPTDYDKIKKFLVCGFPDSLYVFNPNKHGFVNDVISDARIPYKNSILTKGNQFIVGMPLNISNVIDTPTNNYKRLILATRYSLDEVLQFFSDMLTKNWSIDENEVITEHVFYHDVEITSYPLGTVDELKASHPEQFHEEKKHYPKFNQTICLLYFHDLKIKSI